MRVKAKSDSIKHLLIDKKMTNKELSKQIYVSHEYVNAIINGRVHTTYRTATLIALCLGREVSELFTEMEEEICLNK
ncbi:helix-turn-helix domain-containing protein [Mammaliicoccus vitulinus]|uniref:helix-turn-helix domain-containing protein n=1 Tax=Mammaliicoccus vitulinus TaxID=71237 RepID=UPI00186811E9|nr:helix-turn-helix transcriptional regulator [Mammaliicoccus vitulinus]